jgi:hypothetical protein
MLTALRETRHCIGCIKKNSGPESRKGADAEKIIDKSLSMPLIYIIVLTSTRYILFLKVLKLSKNHLSTYKPFKMHFSTIFPVLITALAPAVILAAPIDHLGGPPGAPYGPSPSGVSGAIPSGAPPPKPSGDFGAFSGPPPCGTPPPLPATTRGVAHTNHYGFDEHKSLMWIYF